MDKASRKKKIAEGVNVNARSAINGEPKAGLKQSWKAGIERIANGENAKGLNPRRACR